jgi:hypothetical protein
MSKYVVVGRLPTVPYFCTYANVFPIFRLPYESGSAPLICYELTCTGCCCCCCCCWGGAFHTTSFWDSAAQSLCCTQQTALVIHKEPGKKISPPNHTFRIFIHYVRDPRVKTTGSGSATIVAEPELFFTVPVPAPYLDHKKHSFTKKLLGKNLANFIYIISF